MSLKNPVTPSGIDHGTVRLVAQRLNHYATPRPQLLLIYIYLLIYKRNISLQRKLHLLHMSVNLNREVQDLVFDAVLVFKKKVPQPPHTS